MTPEFLTNPELGAKIKYVARGKHFRAAVAFWGAEALSIVLDDSNNPVFYCDLLSGSTNPRVIHELGKEKFRHVKNLHAKVYCSENGTVVCSANFSKNGIFNNVEAGVFVENSGFVANIFKQCEEASENITDDMMREAYKQWEKRAVDKKDFNNGHINNNEDDNKSQVIKLAFEQYAPRLREVFFPTASLSTEELKKNVQEIGNTEFKFHVKELLDEKRYFFQIKKASTLLMRIRTEPLGTSPVSGMIAEINDELYLLHDPERVNDKNNPPQLRNSIEFEGTNWSTFAITSEHFAEDFLDYELSRPA